MTRIRIYNSFSGKKEVFKPLKNKLVKMYVCGPTVYGPSHLGHATTYLRFDFVRRTLEFFSYKVKFVMNITDIHDDILKKSRELKISPITLSKKYEKEFYKDLQSIKIKKAFCYPKVSQHLKEIIDLIKILIKKGYAYSADDGVYFRISKFKNYGKLSKINIKKEITGTRIKSDKYEKEEVGDFALWKKENDEWLFESPWGKGRPGWHIECSAMSAKYLGIPFDLHGGALDLKFPHHENEIAQSEAAWDKKFVNFYLHSGLLYINGEKMSKSSGNYIELRDFLKNNTPRFLRFFVLNHHYRSSIDFNKEKIDEAKNSFFSLNEKIAKIKYLQSSSNQKNIRKKISFNLDKYSEKIISALKNDFNSPLAISYIFVMLNHLEKILQEGYLTKEIKKEVLNFLKKIDKVFVFLFPWQKINKNNLNLIKKREILRKSKKFSQADKIREILVSKNIFLADLKEKTLIINLN